MRGPRTRTRPRSPGHTSSDPGGTGLANGSLTYYATGKRKNATAKVWLVPDGSGTITVNGRELPDYVQRRTLEQIVLQPLRLTETDGQFDVKAKVLGGGISGQAGALRHG